MTSTHAKRQAAYKRAVFAGLYRMADEIAIKPLPASATALERAYWADARAKSYERLTRSPTDMEVPTKGEPL